MNLALVFDLFYFNTVKLKFSNKTIWSNSFIPKLAELSIHSQDIEERKIPIYTNKDTGSHPVVQLFNINLTVLSGFVLELWNNYT